jgi:hypothetical protein
MALVSPGTIPGNAVYVDLGTEAPLALRRNERDKGSYVVDESHVHGIMDGEMPKPSGVPEQQFVAALRVGSRNLSSDGERFCAAKCKFHF